MLVNNNIKFPDKCKSQYFKKKNKPKRMQFVIDESLFKPKCLRLFKDLQTLSQNVVLTNLLISNKELSPAINTASDLAEKQPKLEALKRQLEKSNEEFLREFVNALLKDLLVMNTRLLQLKEGRVVKKESQFHLDLLEIYFPDPSNFHTVQENDFHKQEFLDSLNELEVKPV